MALVALCAVLGARVVGSADDTVGVWVAGRALNQGQPVTGADLARRQVRFDEQADADRYVSADRDVPAGTVVDRPVGAGELLPRDALSVEGPGSLTEVPLSVGMESVPSTVQAGSTVDVWVTPDAPATQTGAPADAARRSALVFDDVPVVSAPRSSTTLGPTSTRSVVVGLGADQLSRLSVSIAALAGGEVTLTVQR
jgi:hypothetical protein